MDIRTYRDLVVGSVEKVIVGKTDTIEKVLAAFLCGGHVLLEDVPGTGKTMLLRAFARSLGGSFKRIQLTPDLLPSDLTGIHFYDREKNAFIFRPGPVFANFVLADEINRATPRTQSALLECMAEGQVSIDGETMPMAEPFMLLATQNPLESVGTFPLPEAQKDRFMMRLSLGYMQRDEEISLLAGGTPEKALAALESIVSAEDTAACRAEADNVRIGGDVLGYLMDIVSATRNDGRIRTGVSTRGAIALLKGAKAFAALRGRSFVMPEDIKALAVPVLAHRVITAGFDSRPEAEELIRSIVESCPVPSETV